MAKKGMTFKEATDAAIDKGKYIRHPNMGPGWTIGCHPKFPGELWCFNPRTGSTYAYTADAADKARTDWSAGLHKVDQASLDAEAEADAADEN